MKQILIERGMSQVELASRSSLSESYISRACRGDFKGVQQMNFERIARALSLTPSELSQGLRGNERITLYKETPEQLMERLRLIHPVTVPIYEEFSVNAGGPEDTIDFTPILRDRAKGRNLEGYIAHGNFRELDIKDGDLIIIDRDGQIDSGNIVACLLADSRQFHLAKLRKIADETYLEINDWRIRLEEARIAAPVIEVQRRLK